jgi:hypothetical protein
LDAGSGEISSGLPSVTDYRLERATPGVKQVLVFALSTGLVLMKMLPNPWIVMKRRRSKAIAREHSDVRSPAILESVLTSIWMQLRSITPMLESQSPSVTHFAACEV